MSTLFRKVFQKTFYFLVFSLVFSRLLTFSNFPLHFFNNLSGRKNAAFSAAF